MTQTNYNMSKVRSTGSEIEVRLQKIGFYIKSQFGKTSTLLNASKATNLSYKLIPTMPNACIETAKRLSAGKNFQNKIAAIREAGFDLKFSKPENSIFSSNLTLIDSNLPEIIAMMLLDYYSTSECLVQSLVDRMETSNPLDYPSATTYKYYSYKVKRFLTEVALGMSPSKVWKGYAGATGGDLLVKDDGDLLCYHIYNRNEFEDYLLRSTKFEMAGTSRHKFGSVFLNEDNEPMIKLNLQIRFIK